MLHKKTNSETNDDSHTQTHDVSLPNAAYIGHVGTDVPVEKRTPFITAIESLPSGEIVICDRFNKRLKLLDKTWKITDYIELPSGPHDVSIVDNEHAIMTMPMSRQLQYVQVFPMMTDGRAIQLGKTCWGIEVFNSELYVSIHYGYGGDDGEVDVLDLDGNIKRTISIHQDGINLFLRCPFYLRINPVCRRLCVSDFGWPLVYPPVPSTLYCLTLDGDVVYSYQDSGWRGGGGVCVDDRDNNIFVCGQYSNNIQVVTQDGAKHKLLLTTNYGITQPSCIAVRPSDSTLVVGCWGCENLFMFDLGKSTSRKQ